MKSFDKSESALDMISGGLRNASIPRLGFGCGELFPRSNRSECLVLLQTALDAGIRWFDTARLYGLGRAEGILGRLTARHRDQMILVSKAGIMPAEMTLSWRLRAKANKSIRRLPGFRDVVTEMPPLTPTFGAFSPSALRASVEKSLKELRTDYLDLLLLHECEARHVEDPELLETLRALRAEGKVRGFGTATQTDETARIASVAPDDFTVFQYPAPLGGAFDHQLLRPRHGIAVTHSILGPLLTEFTAFMSAHAEEVLVDCEAMGIQAGDKSAWAARLLALALKQNSTGVVLFSSSKADNIRQSMSALDIPEADVRRTAELVARFIRTRPKAAVTA